MKGCMGTIDQRAVVNAVAACAFPGLDRSELEMFAADQVGSGDDPRRFGFHWNTTTGRLDFNLDREGSILHDVGWDHLEGGRMVNDVSTFRVDHMPCGGAKMSGQGREGLRYALDEMTAMKLLMMNDPDSEL